MFVSEDMLCVLNLVSGLLSDASAPILPRVAPLESLKLAIKINGWKELIIFRN